MHALTDADYEMAALRADKKYGWLTKRSQYGLLAIPQPPRNNGPLYFVVAFVLLCLAGVYGVSKADMRFVHTTCDANTEGCK